MLLIIDCIYLALCFWRFFAIVSLYVVDMFAYYLNTLFEYLSLYMGQQCKIFSSLQHLDQLWGPPSILSNGYQGLFPQGGNLQGHIGNRFPPSNAECDKTMINISCVDFPFMVDTSMAAGKKPLVRTSFPAYLIFRE
jgi:hypothetical protein